MPVLQKRGNILNCDRSLGPLQIRADLHQKPFALVVCLDHSIILSIVFGVSSCSVFKYFFQKSHQKTLSSCAFLCKTKNILIKEILFQLTTKRNNLTKTYSVFPHQTDNPVSSTCILRYTDVYVTVVYMCSGLFFIYVSYLQFIIY